MSRSLIGGEVNYTLRVISIISLLINCERCQAEGVEFVYIAHREQWIELETSEWEIVPSAL